MITIKVSYECAKCSAENIKQDVCGNDNVFDLRYGANQNCVKLIAENKCKNCGHLQEFKLNLIAVKKEN